MKRLISLLLIAFMVASAYSQQWPPVNPEARPGTRWWWMGSAVDSINLRYNIDAYADAGIGTVEITPIYGVQGNESNELDFLSKEWMNALAYVQKMADRNGMNVDMNTGTGWPFGGPEISLDMAACKVIALVDTVASGQKPLKCVAEKDRGISKLIAESRRALVNGKEEVVRLYESRTLQKVKRAAPGGDGLVMDHFNREAVAKYLDKFSNAFDSNGYRYPMHFFNDSYEVYRANWTPKLFSEFEKRRGYRLQDKLPELLGLVEDGNATLGDYRETLSDLLLENFTTQWTDWAHRRGVETRNQAHGSPANLIDLYAAVDVPEIEGFGLTDFGIKGLRDENPEFIRFRDTELSTLKYAPSAAHITGKPLVSCETFTWLTEHFRTSLSQMKPDLDFLFTCGINHVFYHGTTYSPKDDSWPGWKFYASIDMSPTNTIWRDVPYLNDYITRCQSFLQYGQPDNDFLVYYPIRDMWRKRLVPGDEGLLLTFEIHKMRDRVPEFISEIMKIDSLGYDFDYISDRYLMTTDFSDGFLTTAAGTKYKGLVIPGSGNLPVELMQHLDSLEKCGARIIRGIDGEAMRNTTAAEPMRTDLKLRMVRRKNDSGFHYFIANLTPDDVDAMVPLAVDFVDAAWFDPMTGDIRRAYIKDGKIQVNFRSGESRILCTYDRPMTLAPAGCAVSVPDTISLTNCSWKLSFKDSYPDIDKVFTLDALKPWTSIGDDILDELAGTGVYNATFTLCDRDLSGDWCIDLGDVRESARVYMNGEYLGCAWAVPFTLDCKGALRNGENELSIEVTNLTANRIRALDRRGVKWRKFKEINIVNVKYKKSTYEDWNVMPAGLNSEVRLIRR